MFEKLYSMKRSNKWALQQIGIQIIYENISKKKHNENNLKNGAKQEWKANKKDKQIVKWI